MPHIRLAVVEAYPRCFRRLGVFIIPLSSFLSTLLFAVVASFIVGDLLDEDSTGWACFDFYNYGEKLLQITGGSRPGMIPCFI